METLDVDPVERLLDVDEVAARLGIHRVTVYAMVQEKLFPAPIMIRKRPRWSVRDFNAYIQRLREEKAAEIEAAAKKRAKRRAS